MKAHNNLGFPTEFELIIVDVCSQDVFVPGPNEKPLFTAEPLTVDDLSLLAELFYLPYEHGNKAVQMLKEFNWLRANSSVVSVNCKRKETEKVGSSFQLTHRMRERGLSEESSSLLTVPACDKCWLLKTKWWMCTTHTVHWVVWL